jgi:hypothetical protein
MTQSEYLSWLEFYRNEPFDDYHRFHRPAALVSVSMSGGDVQERLDWLRPDAAADGWSEADLRTMKAFGVKPQPRKET